MKPGIINLITVLPIYTGICALIIAILNRFIKNLIKFGIDYYFQKKDKRQSD